MKHTLVIMIVMGCLLMGCSPAATPSEPAGEPTLAPIPLETEPPVIPTSTSMDLPAPTLEQQAPVCTVDPLANACTPPKVSTLSKFCVSKIPYTLLGVPPSATFEPLDENLKCKDESVWGGVREISCTGQELYTYEIKVCDTSCTGAGLESGSGRCPEGYGYSSQANCCWKPPTLEPGCVIFKLDIGACK